MSEILSHREQEAADSRLLLVLHSSRHAPTQDGRVSSRTLKQTQTQISVSWLHITAGLTL